MFANSQILDLIESNSLRGAPVDVKGVKVPFYIVGDAAYPLLDTLITPFKHNQVLSESGTPLWLLPGQKHKSGTRPTGSSADVSSQASQGGK